MENNIQLYGVSKSGVQTTLREKLVQRFQPHQFVRLMNIDDEAFSWQAFDPKDEDHYIDKGPTKVTMRRMPKIFTIEPGKSGVFEGWNAYIMIDKLYKKIVAKEALKGRPAVTADGKPRDISMAWYDSAKQDKYIDRIFLGVEEPTFSGSNISQSNVHATLESHRAVEADQVLKAGRAQSSTEKALKDLGLNNESSN